LLLTDLKLTGGISGFELAERMRKTKPGLKVVYTADSTPDKEAKEPVSLEGLQFVPKPFSPDRLLQAIEACFSDKTAA